MTGRQGVAILATEILQPQAFRVGALCGCRLLFGFIERPRDKP